MQITSLQHPLIKHWVALRKENSYRKESNTVLLIGDTIIQEFPHPIKALISTKPSNIRAEKKYLVTVEMLHKIAGLGSFEGIIAEVDLPSPQNVEEKNFVLIVDQIQDPGNLGTLLRAALGLGWEGIMATPGTADFFNDKTIRASRGAIFHLPFAYKTPEEIAAWVERKKIPLWIADAKGTPINEIPCKPPIALLLSHEGQGVREWSRAIGRPLSVPLQNNVESLNVAIAGAILLYEMRGSP